MRHRTSHIANYYQPTRVDRRRQQQRLPDASAILSSPPLARVPVALSDRIETKTGALVRDERHGQAPSICGGADGRLAAEMTVRVRQMNRLYAGRGGLSDGPTARQPVSLRLL
uniref:Uncharacterized protein n=1 Tax=Plectus sambesii TaxID=2011161 RepID=A0A914VDX5_9BILA